MTTAERLEWRETTTAREDHGCWQCEETIPAGILHVVVSNTTPLGGVVSIRNHEKCQAAAEAVEQMFPNGRAEECVTPEMWAEMVRLVGKGRGLHGYRFDCVHCGAKRVKLAHLMLWECERRWPPASA